MPVAPSEPCISLKELGERSIVDKLLEVNGSIRANKRPINWVQNLKCLSIPRMEGTLFRLEQIAHTGEERKYIAVSYSRQAMAGETQEPEDCFVQFEPQSIRQSTVRDSILSRAVRYARHVGVGHIWIDCECIDEASKEEAMNSMDLVYKKSLYPLGLLGTVLNDVKDIELLGHLLQGRFAYEGDDEPRLRNHSIEDDSEVMRLLQRFQKDLWWNRAWIFQEDYLGEPQMVLLIRHSCGNSDGLRNFPSRENNCEPLWVIKGEVCIKAHVFRQQATVFLLALKKQASTEYAEQCEVLLGFFGKYNVLYQYDDAAKGRAMSSRIFADILKRDATEKYDLLPIAANCCGHKFRLNSKDMQASSFSLGLCALVLYIKNGEIIANDKSTMKSPTDSNLADFLNDVSFNAFDPPVGRWELTWLKNCRLSHVKLLPKGMRTMGYLWRVFDRFDITHWDLSNPPGGDIETFCLDELARKLRAAAKSRKILESRLPELLTDYLETFWPSEDTSAAKEHMRIMAVEIARAIMHEDPGLLSLAKLQSGGADTYAIFIGDFDDGDLIFTSWSDDQEEDGRRRTSHVSFVVRAEKSSERARVLRLTKWVNGLAFFNSSHEQEEVVFGWPESWTKRKTSGGLKRKRERPL